MEDANKFVFIHPNRCVIAGPSGCGKSEFMQSVIQNKETLFTIVPQRVIYTYKYPQTWFSRFPNVEFTKEVPRLLDPFVPSLIVLDDVVCDTSVMKECVSLFVRGSHHMNASVFFITQNLFSNSSDFRTISLNANSFILFKTVRGLHQIETLARQIYNKSAVKDFLDAYKDATREPYSYLIVDLFPEQKHRIRSRVLPEEGGEIIYLIE